MNPAKFHVRKIVYSVAHEIQGLESLPAKLLIAARLEKERAE